MKRAIITGILGQDGSFLYELLERLGYQVYGIARKNLSTNSKKIKDELSKRGKNPIIYEVDLQEYEEIKNVIKAIQPDEIYHLSASHVSSEGRRNGEAIDENQLFKWNVSATANVLAACNEIARGTKILTAGSCLMFDSSRTKEQDETTIYSSDSLYGIGKITENKIVDYYRKRGLFACTAILYNHESYRRSEDFVTKKIVRNMCRLKKDNNHCFSLGNIEIKKDWGYAKDYVKGMYLMLQGERPQDYILSSGELHSIKEFIDVCAEILQIKDWHEHVEINCNITNRNNGTQLFGNPKKIETELGWKKEKGFKEWISEMIMEEMR
ncbi:NAD-dependent epimerase/dehydratase family protein [Lachnospiraceae bacterium]|nr:NAD-dependent epimerase/dehydratase family protein [Lachnospiraceae bacterium]